MHVICFYMYACVFLNLFMFIIISYSFLVTMFVGGVQATALEYYGVIPEANKDLEPEVLFQVVTRSRTAIVSLVCVKLKIYFVFVCVL